MSHVILAFNIFTSDVTKRYDRTDATIEILAMLIGAAFLGFLIRHFMGFLRKKEIIIEPESNIDAENQAKFIAESSNTSDHTSKIQLHEEITALRKEIDRIAALKICQCNCGSESKTVIIHSPAIDSVKSESKEISNQESLTTEVKTQPIINPNLEVSKEELKEVVQPVLKEDNKDEMEKQDDLKVIEGIGPAIEKLLNNHNILSYKQLASESVVNLERLLDEAGPRFRVHVPETWPEQARLLFENKMDEFKILTENLKGGRRV